MCFAASPAIIVYSESSSKVSASGTSSGTVAVSGESERSTPESSLGSIISLGILSSAFGSSTAVSFAFSGVVLFSFLRFAVPSNVLPVWILPQVQRMWFSSLFSTFRPSSFRLGKLRLAPPACSRVRRSSLKASRFLHRPSLRPLR